MSLPRYGEYKESGIPWIGQAPAHWLISTLGRVSIDRCDGPFGSGIKSDHYTDEGALVVRLQNIRAGWFHLGEPVYLDQHYFDSELRGHEVLPGDVLVAGLGDENNLLGRACVAPERVGSALVKADCFRFRLDASKGLPKFIAMQLSAGAHFDAGTLSTGTTRSRIPLGTMATRRLVLPPLEEQLAIASFLDRETGKIDALIAEQEKLIALLAEKRQATISHAVTRGLDPDAPMKDSGVAWLGDVPAHWEVVGLTKYLDSVVDYRGRTPTKVDEGVFLVTAKNIRDGFIDYGASQEYIGMAEYDEVMRRGRPRVGDVLFTTEAPLGQVALVDREDIALAQRIIKFRADPSRLSNAFLKAWVMGEACQFNLEQLATGSTALGIKGSKIGQVRLCLPPLPEQDAIVSHIDVELARLSRLEAVAVGAITLLKERRSALIAAAVTGQIDVRKA